MRSIVGLLPTLALGAVGAVIATYLRLPIPWMLGALFACAGACAVGLPIRTLPNVVERWMRVVIGVSLGPAVMQSLSNNASDLPLAIVVTLVLVASSVAFGMRWFERQGPLPKPAAYMTALPGGLSMLMAMAGDIGNRASVLMAHTVRVVLVVVSISLLARYLGVPTSTTPLQDSFVWRSDSWWLLPPLIIGGFFLAERLRIAGGHVIVPMIVTAILSAVTGWTLEPPALLKTIALLVFGIVLGCEVAGGPRETYGRLFKASMIFTTMFMLVAAGLSLMLVQVTDLGFLVLFLAMAPGGIAEVSLVALALGLDAGFVALVHACRFTAIIMVGPIGLRWLQK